MCNETDPVDLDREAERILRVYQDYATPARARLYDLKNRGNRAMVKERHSLIRRLLEAFGLSALRGRQVLDVGCGYGHELARMREFGAEVRDLVGIDLMTNRIVQARLSYPDIDFRIINATRLPFPNATFDLILSFTVFSSVLTPETARRIASGSGYPFSPA